MDGSLRYQERVFVPSNKQLREEILKEHHCSSFAVHPSSTKLYQDIKRQYWWKGMKADVARFVAKCLNCQQVKIEHQRPGGLLQPLPVVEWK